MARYADKGRSPGSGRPQNREDRASPVGKKTPPRPQAASGAEGKTSSARKLADPAFPFPSGELLERGLAELGFPREDAAYAPSRAADEAVGGGVSAGGAGASSGSVYRTVGIRGSLSIVKLVNAYIRELELFNAVFDLVGAEPGTENGRSDLVVRHILDSLAPWKEIAALAIREADAGCEAGAQAALVSGIRVADAGSGAGFPGIPLAIVFPDISFTLVERMSKRCAFLENCKAILGLKNVTVLNSEVERAPAGQFDIVVFRAFRPLDREMVRTLLAMTRVPSDGNARPAGVLAAWKAKREKIDEEMNGISDEVDGWEVLPLAVPFLGHEERHLVITSSARRPSRPS
mgnify:CR=1 FL=1